MYLNALIAFATALSATYLVLPGLNRIAPRVGLMDYPNGRKKHGMPRALVGGIGMAVGVGLSASLMVPLSGLWGFVAGLLVLLFVGVFDDFRELRHRVKFLFQIVAAFLLVYPSGVVLHTFGDLVGVGAINFGVLSVPVTLFCAVGVINALNMIDGLDGLAGGVSLVAFGSFTVLAALNGQMVLMLLSLSFLGAVLAFLHFNQHPALLFMGDAGSISLGFALAFFSIAITQAPDTHVSPVAALLVMGVPITDTLLVMAGRVKRKESPFKADRLHFHHILIRLGYSSQAAVFIIVGLTGLLSTVAVLGTIFRLPEFMLFSFCLVYFFSALILSLNMKRLYRRLKGKRLPFAGAQVKGPAYAAPPVPEAMPSMHRGLPLSYMRPRTPSEKR